MIPGLFQRSNKSKRSTEPQEAPFLNANSIEEKIKQIMPGLDSDVIASVVKLMSNQELIKVGQTVFFRKYAGNEVTLDGVTHMIMREEEILAVLS